MTQHLPECRLFEADPNAPCTIACADQQKAHTPECLAYQAERRTKFCLLSCKVDQHIFDPELKARTLANVAGLD